MTVQDRISELLKERGWSKYKLAKEAGFYKATVYDWFNEKHFTPDRESIEMVCAALEISQAEFYSGVDESDLNAEQVKLLELFEKIPKNKRQIIFDLMNSFIDEK